MVNIIKDNSIVVDIGTGGGFPGIPLAIMLPNVKFYLVDSITKKIVVVNDIVRSIGLQNVETATVRAETINRKFDYIVSRSVMNLIDFYNNFNKLLNNNVDGGIIYLKGGDTSEEENSFRKKITIFSINNIFEEDYFETKKIVYIKK